MHRKYFDSAHAFARIGSSAYAGASNAIHAAGAETASGSSKLQVAKWVTRAAVFAAGLHDSEGLSGQRAALRTIGNHGPSLRSQSMAIDRVIGWRTV